MISKKYKNIKKDKTYLIIYILKPKINNFPHILPEGFGINNIEVSLKMKNNYVNAQNFI